MIKYISLLTANIVLSISLFAQLSETTTNSESILKYKERRNLMHQQKALKFDVADNFEKQKLDSIIEFNFNETTDNWDKKFTKDAYTYDDNFNEVFYLHSSWNNEKNDWQGLWKKYLDYDDQGRLIRNTAYTWGAGEMWGEMYKDTFTYNNKNELIEAIYHSWSNTKSQWVLTEKHLYKYDESGKIISDSTYYLYDGSEDWVLVEKNQYEYLNDEYLHYIYKSKWDKDKNQWINEKRAWYLYGNIYWELTSIYHSKWDETESDWLLSQVEGFGYDDTREYTTTHTTVNRDIETNKWVSAYSHRYSFDYTLSFDELVLPWSFKNYDKKYHHHKLENKELLSRNFDTNEYEQYRDVKYFFSPAETDVVNGMEDVENEKITIYPNPTKERITVNYEQASAKAFFKLMDIHGRKTMSKMIFSGEKIDISSLKPGIYFYKLLIKEKVETGKLIKE